MAHGQPGAGQDERGRHAVLASLTGVEGVPTADEIEHRLVHWSTVRAQGAAAHERLWAAVLAAGTALLIALAFPAFARRDLRQSG